MTILRKNILTLHGDCRMSFITLIVLRKENLIKVLFQQSYLMRTSKVNKNIFRTWTNKLKTRGQYVHFLISSLIITGGEQYSKEKFVSWKKYCSLFLLIIEIGYFLENKKKKMELIDVRRVISRKFRLVYIIYVFLFVLYILSTLVYL